MIMIMHIQYFVFVLLAHECRKSPGEAFIIDSE